MQEQQQVHVFGIGFYVGAIIVISSSSRSHTRPNCHSIHGEKGRKEKNNRFRTHSNSIGRDKARRRVKKSVQFNHNIDNGQYLRQVHHHRMPFDLAIILFVRIVWNATKTMSTWFLMRVEKIPNNFTEQ